MRRKDREITQAEKIDEIIQKCDCCRIGLSDHGQVYIVPLNFAYLHEGGKRIFYFHSAKEGRKVDLIQKNGEAGFELDTNHALNRAEIACGFSYRFQSIIGTGKIFFIQELAEKRRALQLILEKYTGNSDWKFDSNMEEQVAIIKLVVEEISCKEHQ